jgi:hypothetical protein
MKFDVVVFTKPKEHGIATKRIKLVNGEIDSDASECRMWDGAARVESVRGVDGFEALINGFSSQQFICLGAIKAEFKPRQGEKVRVVSKDIYASLPDKRGVITRTLDCFEFPAGVGPMLLDIDYKGMPADVQQKGKPWDILVSLFPMLGNAARVERSSTSSGLYDAKTNKSYERSGGSHIYPIVQDARDIPRVIDVIFDTLWANGFGWSLVSKGGAVLTRGLIDASVGSPERPIFEGAPAVEPPLAQDKSRRATAIDGSILDTRAAFPDPTAEIKQRAEQARAEWRARLKPEAEKVQKAQTEERIEKAVAKAKANNQPPPDRDRLRRELTRAYEENSLVSPDFELAFDDPAIGVVTVAEVLSDRARFIGQTLADPLEGPTYGRCKALVMEDRFNGGLFIKSFAHGGVGYRLVLNEAMIRAMIERAKPEDAVNVFLEAMDEAALFPGGEEALAALCAKRAGAPMTPARALKLLKERRNAEQEAKHEANLAKDGRIVLKAPPRDGEVRKPALAIDAALAGLNSLDAPVRNLNGRLAEIVKVPTPGLHLLTAADANSVGGERKLIEAPPEFTIREMTDARVGVVVEKYIRLERMTKNGRQSVALPDSCVGAINALHDESRLPIVSGIQTLPLVCAGADGLISIRKTSGIDRASGVMFIIEPEIAVALPNPETITSKDAERAYDRLVNVWFGEVAASDDNKAVLVSIPLTVMQRLLLRAARPGYLITAAVAGAGKTTLAHMISEALFGRAAAAAAWSSNPETRRTALFSYLLAVTPLLLWDNIARETALNCDYVNAALTSPTISDRMYHTQTTREAAATTIQVFTGNSIIASGDMRSRVFKAALMVDREDPENRPFKRSDPLRWTRENRASILHDLYTILCWRPGAPVREKTRMKAWHGMIGHPIELLSGVDFESRISESGGADPTREGLATAVRMLEQRFKRDAFYARDVASAMRQTPSDGDADADATPALLKPAWTQDEVEQFQDSLRTAMDEKEETSRGRWPVDTWISQRIGRRLQTLANRPVAIDRCTMTLRINPASAKRGAAFSIEIDV